MKKISVVIKEAVENAFVSLGYDKKYGMVSISNRPDLCQYQCNGAMAAVKEYKKAPLVIAEEVADKLKLSEEGKIFEKIEAVKSGFINLTLKDEFLADYVNEMGGNDNFGYETEGKPKKIVIDYGGPNVAKPLHIGHLRSAIIGESIKRTERFAGNEVIGDVHLGDWGLQMGLIITELKHRKPELVYFDESFIGEYPKEAPFTIGELEEIYPAASARSKEDEEYKNEALQATAFLQSGNRGYLALWNHILSVSVADLKKNYENLNVSFDLWKKESDAQPYIPDMVEKMKADGFAYTSEGALVVDVAREDDKKEVPPCIILKSDGASLYSTTDLATIVERVKLFNPTDILYVVDKRQEMHFEQVFRAAKKTGIAPPELNLTFLGFGTMNGKDGKPFKTREGGVMRLERLIAEITEEVEEDLVIEETSQVQETVQEKYDRSLKKTRTGFGARLNAFFANFRSVDEEFFEELEELLIMSDVGVQVASNLTEELRYEAKLENAKKPDALRRVIIEKLVELYEKDGQYNESINFQDGLTVMLFVGVNGVGKTTSIGKLAHRYKQAGKKVMLVAADTFRAGAVAQLAEWGRRVDVPVVTGPEKADPASVVFDGMERAVAEGVDILMIDTAGRLQNKENLMAELEKIGRIIKRVVPEAPHETFLALDASTGQNALVQAKEFSKITPVTGIVLTKIDGTARGGVVLAIREELNIPVKLIGFGEKIDDIGEFNSENFMKGLLEGLI